MQRRVLAPRYERGVFWAYGTKGGRPQIFAIDSRGEEIARETLEDDTWATAERAVECMWHLLNQRDPLPVTARPQLRVVRVHEMPATTAPPAIEYDPYNPPPLNGRWRLPW